MTLWHSHQAAALIDTVITRFNQEGHHQVRVEQFEPGKIKGDLLLAAQTKGLPDLMLIPSDFIGLHQQMSLAPLPKAWFSKDLMAKALHYVTLDQQRWGVPMTQGNHLMLFYNKSLVTTPITEWQQLASIAPALKAKGIDPISWPYHEMYYFAPFLHTFGGALMSKGNITLDTPAMVQALNAYRAVAQQQWVDPEGGYDRVRTRFNDGKSAYLIDGDWAFHDLANTMGDKLGIAMLPRWHTHPMHSMSGAYVMSTTQAAMADNERQAVIKELFAFIQRPDIQRFIYQQGALLPVSQPVFTAIHQEANPLKKVLLEQFTLTTPMPSESAMSIAWQALGKGFERFMEGQSAAKCAEYMQQLADLQYHKVKS
ncbi:MAG: sugar ABC transporter substrate-binding protein [Aeromonas sp.]